MNETQRRKECDDSIFYKNYEFKDDQKYFIAFEDDEDDEDDKDDKNKKNEGFWNNEEIAELSIKGLITLMEEKFQPVYEISNFERKTIQKDLLSWNYYGIYFPPEGRLTLARHFDYKNDGINPFSTCSQVLTQELAKKRYGNLIEKFGYSLTTQTLTEINKFPKGYYQLGGEYKKYRLAEFISTNRDDLIFQTNYYATDKNGLIYNVIKRNENKHSFDPRKRLLPALVYGLYADKKHLWNVAATEQDDIKLYVIFGVYEEIVKSLFYARSLPLTASGRKRPILHWVKAHKRRIEKGIDINVKKHLRGINKFEMENTKFEITQPQKNSNIHHQATGTE